MAVALSAVLIFAVSGATVALGAGRTTNVDFTSNGLNSVVTTDVVSMTLDDVRAIAREIGPDLTMDDLHGYIGTDVGSGLSVMRYEIADSDYELLVGSGNQPEVWYAYLLPYSGAEDDEAIDIRYYNVDKFIADGTKELVRPLPESVPEETATAALGAEETTNAGFTTEERNSGGDTDAVAMTLDDIRAIAREIGPDLTMDDLLGYIGTEVGSGLSVMQYEIADSDYELLVGSGNPPEVWHADLLPYSGAEDDEAIDIRYYDVDKFIADGTKELVRPMPENAAEETAATALDAEETSNIGFTAD